jgi:hypothetical protein
MARSPQNSNPNNPDKYARQLQRTLPVYYTVKPQLLHRQGLQGVGSPLLLRPLHKIQHHWISKHNSKYIVQIKLWQSEVNPVDARRQIRSVCINLVLETHKSSSAIRHVSNYAKSRERAPYSLAIDHSNSASKDGLQMLARGYQTPTPTIPGQLQKNLLKET